MPGITFSVKQKSSERTGRTKWPTDARLPKCRRSECRVRCGLSGWIGRRSCAHRSRRFALFNNTSLASAPPRGVRGTYALLGSAIRSHVLVALSHHGPHFQIQVRPSRPAKREMSSLEKPAFCSARTAASASDLPAMTAPMPLCGAALETAAWRSRWTSGAVLPGSIEVLTTGCHLCCPSQSACRSSMECIFGA